MLRSLTPSILKSGCSQEASRGSPKGSGCADANLDLEVDGAVAKAVGCPKAGGVPGGFVEEDAGGADPCMHGAVGLPHIPEGEATGSGDDLDLMGAEWFQSTMRVLVISPTMSGWSASKRAPAVVRRMRGSIAP